MIVTLDGRRIDHDLTPGCSLQALIDNMRDELPAGHLVVSVAVNGREFGENDLIDELSQPLDTEDQVDLESGDRLALSADALCGVAEQLTETGRLQPEIADQLNAGQVAQAVGRISEFVQTWQACQNAVVQCSGLVGRDLTQEQFAGRSIENYLGELVERLRDIRDALDARDMVLLADLIHYEVPDLCQTWHDLLLSLAEDLQSDY